MRIDRVQPPPPPKEFRMTFSRDEGWTILAALQQWTRAHPGAVEVETSKKWVADLDRELRR